MTVKQLRIEKKTEHEAIFDETQPMTILKPQKMLKLYVCEPVSLEIYHILTNENSKVIVAIINSQQVIKHYPFLQSIV